MNNVLSSLEILLCVASWAHHLSFPRQTSSVHLARRALAHLCVPLAGPGREVEVGISAAAHPAICFLDENLEMVAMCQGVYIDYVT